MRRQEIKFQILEVGSTGMKYEDGKAASPWNCEICGANILWIQIGYLKYVKTCLGRERKTMLPLYPSLGERDRSRYLGRGKNKEKVREKKGRLKSILFQLLFQYYLLGLFSFFSSHFPLQSPFILSVPLSTSFSLYLFIIILFL